MRLHTMVWFVVLLCFCDEGSFEEAYDDFKSLCAVLSLPGSTTKGNPSDLKATLDTALSYIGLKLFGSSNMNDHFKIAKDRCNTAETDDDPSCAFIDFVNVGNLVADDALSLKEMFSSKAQGFNYYYDLYIEAWFMHPRISKLGCIEPLNNLFEFLGKLRNLNSYDEYYDIKLLYGNITSKGLRQEIDRVCPVSTTETICMIRIWTNIADKIGKFLTYITRDQWQMSTSKLLKNTMQLYFYASQFQVLEWQLSSGKVISPYRLTKANLWIKEITDFIFQSLQNYNIDNLLPLVELLPYTVYLPCDDTAEFLSMDRTMCTFKSMIDSLAWYLARRNTRGNIKLLSSTVDYEKFLQQRRFEQILNIGETTQINLLLVAENLKSALKNNFGELSNYFQTLAEFDLKRVPIDIDYIDSQLDKFKKASEQSSKNLNSLMSKIIKAALLATIGDQVEAFLGFNFALSEFLNPMHILFGGGSTKHTFDATREVSQAMVGVAKAASLKQAFDSLVSEISKFVDKLSKNEIYLNSVAHLIKSLKSISPSSSPSSKLKGQINNFVELYSKYDPAVTKYELEAIIAFWETLVDEACDILDSTSGIVSSITNVIMTAQRDCPNAKVEVQKLVTIYEEIYDFQFQLMDSLSDGMRAFISSQASKAINSDFDKAKHHTPDDPNFFEKLNFISALSMISYKISMLSAIDSYCDILSYTEGHLPSECIGPQTSVTSLLSRTKHTCSTSSEFLSIPTKPSKTGDKAFINLIDLYAGKTVAFKIPDSQWLIHHNWIPSFQKDDKIFVQRFEIYLPVVSMTDNRVHVEVEATVQNQFAPPDGIDYVISPQVRLGFTYREGKSRRICRQEEIPNPYADKCREMPNICPVTTGILKLSLHAIEQPKNRRSYKYVSLRETDMCCTSNHYYDESISNCIACPSGTVDKYGGLFCEGNNQSQLVPVLLNLMINVCVVIPPKC
ncbi:hypothetical protein CHS0354_007828 [Potamilus streckersoni]|uniref:Uncharacterized protein n=1 Tax=Potamilus streckersoni TaxID=2493646 RepID=A0AAE0VWU8_9BIVA|nr:hypothetical protein CHS0354_007828 [Potamilus streckersoni]